MSQTAQSRGLDSLVTRKGVGLQCLTITGGVVVQNFEKRGSTFFLDAKNHKFGHKSHKFGHNIARSNLDTEIKRGIRTKDNGNIREFGEFTCPQNQREEFPHKTKEHFRTKQR